ncbi:integrator complex subunit 5-like protein [Dinothrombium tinctorium]|uniref:Integrator complex subunit 5-like protein n=1 Tax=Dinothrombium tinctorium TaxID=1965070 RepID=A0A443RNF0_9ACAR|nr:integrator complex subunit 5-like protein [Dinothrombium tinctorium]
MAKEDIESELKCFLQFQCESKVIEPRSLIKASLILLRKCHPSRQAVLDFYAELFDNCVLQYCDQNAVDLNETLFARMFRSTTANVPSAIDLQTRRLSVESAHEMHVDSITPQSPPPVQASPADEESIINFKNNIDNFVEQIGETLISFSSESEANYELIIEWTLLTTTRLSAKYADFSIRSVPAVNLLSNLSVPIRFWLNCPVVSLLLKLMLSKQSFADSNTIIKKIIEYSPNSDWICAYLLTSLPSSDTSLYSSCIETLLNSKATPSSITAILSYLSEYNPRAIINSSKSNIPFLLKLCSNSVPLLNLLATESVKLINIQMLNEMSKTLNEDLKNEAIYCIMNAPNAYDLLVLVFEACVHKEANDKVIEQALRILGAIVSQLHEFVYSANVSPTSTLLDALKANVDHLIADCVNRTNSNLRRLQIRILQLLCVHFGINFTTKVIHRVLDSLNINYELLNISGSMPHPLLTSLTKYLRLPFGADIQCCFKNAIKEPVSNSPRFWANLLTVVESDESIEMDIDLLTLKFIECIPKEDSIFSLYYILRLIQSCMEKDRKTVSRPNHHLCIALVDNYMKLLDSIEIDRDNEELKFHILTTSQKCMSSLSTGQTSHQHILCRALIESEFHRNEPSAPVESINSKEVSLLQENKQYGHSFKFRKIPLNPNKRDLNLKNGDNQSSAIRRQLLYDAIRCCVVDIPSFASLLVECITPDVMFNNLPWPDEDFLKVTIERDLHIARKFEKNPILWDLCGFIARDGCLHYCSVLVRALMAVQLTQWASATASKEKLGSTQKLVTLIANSELVPNTPFKYLPQIMPSLTPLEIFCMLNDLWRYMKDNSSSILPSVRHLSTPTKPYLERLRIILSQKFPGRLYVKIFKGLN